MREFPHAALGYPALYAAIFGRSRASAFWTGQKVCLQQRLPALRKPARMAPAVVMKQAHPRTGNQPRRMQASLSMRPRRVVLLVLVALAVLGLGCHLWALWEYRAAQQASARHDYLQAQQRFERCSKVWFLSSETYLLAGRAARRAGNFQEAADHFRACRALAGQEDAVDLEYKLLRVQQGDLAPVAPALESLLAQNHPDSVAILEVLTPAYLQAYQLQNALECIRRWLEREPDRLEAWRYRAQVYSRLQSATPLLESYRRILELQPDDDEVRLHLAEQLLHARQPQEALEQYQTLRPRLGDTPAVLVGMAGCLSAQKQPDEARRLLEQVLAVEPHNAVALAERGRLALQYESPSEAEAWWRRAFAERPVDPDVLYGLFQSLQRTGKQQEAAEIQARLKAIEADLAQLREVLRQIATTPHDPEPRYRAGLILLRNGKENEGLRWLASALLEDPRHAATRQALADYYERAGDAKQAAKFRGSLP
jgi:Tfp pilus assembly protein PilF